MGKQSWKPGNMLYPLPAVLVSVADKRGKTNVFTVRGQGRFAVILPWCLFLSDHSGIPMR